MNAPSAGPPYPRTAYLLALIGGILIALYALVEIVEGVADRARVESVFPGAARLLIVLGAVGVVCGVIVVVGALQLKSNPSTVKTWGVLVLVFSLVSFVGGGGLFIGLVLGLVGGIMALTWNPPSETGTMYGSAAYGAPPGQPMGGAAWGAAPPAAPAVGAPQRFCSSCGSPNLASARTCAKCGAPMP